MTYQLQGEPESDGAMIVCPYQPCSFKVFDLSPERQREWYEHIARGHEDRLGASVGGWRHGGQHGPIEVHVAEDPELG